MAGIAADLQRAEALGLVHTGFSGGAIEYQCYTCPRSGLLLSIPLGDGPYLVHTPSPGYTELARTNLIDEALALIRQAPRNPTLHGK